MTLSVAPKIASKAWPFPLSQVRLLDGPFKRAMDRNGDWLLALEPDRLLHRFRTQVGLAPKGENYGGWEEQGVSGHTLGHYLTACALHFAASGDERYRAPVAYIVDELAECQALRADGYVGAVPEADRIFAEVARGEIRSQGFDLNGGWVPWYTLHKLYAGLIDAYSLCGIDRALGVVTRLADWAIHITSRLSDEQWQAMLECEHGGMNDSLANLSAITGDARYLDLARKFHHQAILDPLAQGEWSHLTGKHANTQVPKVIGAAREYELTGEEPFRIIAETFWDAVVCHHTYVIGGNSDGEHFGPPDQLNGRLSSNTAETCNTYNMLKLTRHLFCWEPSALYADYYERALYNHILASQNPETGMVCYYVSLKPGHFKTWSTPFDSFWCCVGTGIENHAKYGDSIYFQGSDGGLYVNLFIASELHWPEKGLMVRQETNFPAENTSRLTLTCAAPVEMTLSVRSPIWADGGLTVTVNGEAQLVAAGPNGYIEIHRTWADGETVEVAFPMRLRTAGMPDNPDRAALLIGPIVLAGDLGAIDQEEPRVPVLMAAAHGPDEWVKPRGSAPLAFQTDHMGRPADLSLTPFYQVHDRRYSVYWDFFTEEQWQLRETRVVAQ